MNRSLSVPRASSSRILTRTFHVRSVHFIAMMAAASAACGLWPEDSNTGVQPACDGKPCERGIDTPLPTTPAEATGPLGGGWAVGVPGAPSPAAAADAGATTPDASPTQTPKPGDGLQFMAWPAQQSRTSGAWGTVLTDIVNHLPASYGNQYYDADRITFGHETTHGINSHLRVNYGSSTRRHNGFYVLENRGVTLDEPNIRKSAVARYVPAALRESRYGTYVTGQTAWDDTPLYLFDEWIAYINGGEVGVDLVKKNLWNTGWRDGVMGQLEFTTYAIALGMAVEAGDPTYFAQNTQFKEFLAWNIRRSMAVFREGSKMTAFTWDKQDAYYAQLRTGAAGGTLRDFVQRVYGLAFLAEVFELSPL